MANLNIRIRNATEADRHEIVDVHRLSQEVTGIPDPITHPPDSLNERLYERLALRRYVAEYMGRIIGHGMVEFPNTDNIHLWLEGSNHRPEDLLELGGAFVHPGFAGEGVWTKLLEHRLAYVRKTATVAVSATWSQNVHVKRTFVAHEATHVGDKRVSGGAISLYRFD